MNPSVARIASSDGSANASLMTITQVRTAPATTITVNTVAGAPDKFFAVMGAPHTFTDPVTGETITVISEATAVDFAGHIESGKVEIDEIAPGYTDLGSKVGDIIVIRPTSQWANNIHNVLDVSLNDDGTIKDNSVTAAAITDASITAAKLDSATFPKFRAKLTTADTVGNGAFKKVVFNLEDYDIGNNFASSRFTASVAGYYHFASALHVSGGVTLLILSFYKNGVEVARGDRLQGMSSSSVGASAATDIYLAVGDYVEVFCQANSATSIETSGVTTIFSGHMIP